MKRQYNYEFHRNRILQVLRANPKGMLKNNLRAVAFNRVPAAVSDNWLDIMVSDGTIETGINPKQTRGRPGTIYRLGSRAP